MLLLAHATGTMHAILHELHDLNSLVTRLQTSIGNTLGIKQLVYDGSTELFYLLLPPSQLLHDVLYILR